MIVPKYTDIIDLPDVKGKPYHTLFFDEKGKGHWLPNNVEFIQVVNKTTLLKNHHKNTEIKNSVENIIIYLPTTPILGQVHIIKMKEDPVKTAYTYEIKSTTHEVDEKITFVRKSQRIKLKFNGEEWTVYENNS